MKLRKFAPGFLSRHSRLTGLASIRGVRVFGGYGFFLFVMTTRYAVTTAVMALILVNPDSCAVPLAMEFHEFHINFILHSALDSGGTL